MKSVRCKAKLRLCVARGVIASPPIERSKKKVSDMRSQVRRSERKAPRETTAPAARSPRAAKPKQADTADVTPLPKRDPVRTRRVLVVDDDVVTRRALEGLLTKRGFEVVTTRSGEEAWAVLQKDDAPRLAIIDWMMPGMDGVELCRKLRHSGKGEYTYILMLTGRRAAQDVVDGLKSGADDYLRKPFNLDELHARLQTAQRIVTLQERLRRQATVDELTRVMSRSAVFDVLRREWSKAKRDSKPLAVILGDVDHFKNVNDSYGHIFGDSVLRHVAHLLSTHVRPYDAVGRYGGEEFLIVLPGCSPSDAVAIAERARKVVAENPIVTSSGPVPVTISLGVASIDSHADSVDQLITRADEALYRAKRAGRNRTARTIR